MNGFANMLSHLKRLLVSARTGLFTLSSGKKVGRFAIVMILLLDMQVLYSVLSGASRAGESAELPVSRVPAQCQSFYKTFPSMKDDEKLEFVAAFDPKKGRDPTRALTASAGVYEPEVEAEPAAEATAIVTADAAGDAASNAAPDAAPDASSATQSATQNVASSATASASADATSIERSDTAQVAQACKDARGEFTALGKDAHFFSLYQERAQLISGNAALQGQISSLTDSYDSALLEKIAGQKSADSILPAAAQDIRKKIDRARSDLASQTAQIQTLRQQILRSAPFSRLLAFAKRPAAQAEIDRDLSAYQRALQLYPVKSLGLSVLFLMPLLAIAIGWNRRAKRRDAPLQTMASSHMILIALLPILFKIFYFFYELIPHTFFSRLFDLLTAMNLTYLWNYVAIIGSILLVSLVIWISQKFVLNSARKRRSRIKRSECVACEEKLSSRELPY
ncbi:MAG: hypothetical protein M3N23_01665, partial [Pseudomonadota bacterium]|nr:hypothetical protein [Pseudomonadota bacterium]